MPGKVHTHILLVQNDGKMLKMQRAELLRFMPGKSVYWPACALGLSAVCSASRAYPDHFIVSAHVTFGRIMERFLAEKLIFIYLTQISLSPRLAGGRGGRERNGYQLKSLIHYQPINAQDLDC